MSRLQELLDELCPNGVEYKKLGELGSFYGGLTGKSKDDFQDGNAIFITYKNVYSNLALDICPEEKVKISEGEKQRTLEYGDVIFTGSSETPDECGISSVVTEVPTEPLYLNSFCFFLRFNDKNIFEPNFTKHLFRSSELRYQIGKTASGVTRYNVSKKAMEKVSVPVPPLEVQCEIVRVLDSFTLLTDELTDELTARKKQYDYYKNHILSDIDGQKVKLKDVIVSLHTGLNPRKFFVLNTDDASNYYVTIREFKGGYLHFDEKTDMINDEALRLCNNRSNLEQGDLLFSGTGTIGETLVIEEEPNNWNIKEGVYSIKPDKSRIDVKYLKHVLTSKRMKDKYATISEGGTVKSISMKKMEELEFVLPSLEKQRVIADLLERFDLICNDISDGIPAEIESRKKQYEYYRDKLLSFKELGA